MAVQERLLELSLHYGHTKYRFAGTSSKSRKVVIVDLDLPYSRIKYDFMPETAEQSDKA